MDGFGNDAGEMDTSGPSDEGALLMKPTKSSKKPNNYNLQIGPNELTAEIPANWFDGENISELSEEWAGKTYDIFRFINVKICDTRWHNPVFAQGFLQQTKVTTKQYRFYVEASSMISLSSHVC
jgi:hypothetical protein